MRQDCKIRKKYGQTLLPEFEKIKLVENTKTEKFQMRHFE